MDAELVEVMVRTSRVMVGLAIRSIQASPVPVTVVQHRCLVLLETFGPMTVSAVAEELAVNQSNGSRLCERLERLGLVDRTQNRDDGRVVTVRLTAAGREVLRNVVADRRRQITEIFSDVDLDTRSRSSVLAELTQVLSAFSEAAEHHRFVS